MGRIESILAVRNQTDEGAPFECALSVSQALGASLAVAQTLETLPPGLHAASSLLGLWKRVAAQDQRALDELKGELALKGVVAETKVLTGMPFIELIREVIRQRHGLLIKGAEGRASLKGLWGSTDLHLLRKCPCPVLILKPGQGQFRKILAAVDPGPDGPEGEGLNLKILEYAASLARVWGASVQVVHAWELLSENLLRVRDLLSAQELETFLRETHAQHGRWLKRLIEKADLSGLELSTHLIKGSPWEVIPAALNRKGADLLVMGTLGRSGLPGLFIGNTAEKMLGRISSSVLAIKPDGFVSPVRP